jgi:hypothetical protein
MGSFDDIVKKERGNRLCSSTCLACSPIRLLRENGLEVQWSPKYFSYEILYVTPLDDHKFVLDLRKSQGELANDLYHFIQLIIEDERSKGDNKEGH